MNLKYEGKKQNPKSLAKAALGVNVPYEPRHAWQFEGLVALTGLRASYHCRYLGLVLNPSLTTSRVVAQNGGRPNFVRERTEGPQPFLSSGTPSQYRALYKILGAISNVSTGFKISPPTMMPHVYSGTFYN